MGRTQPHIEGIQPFAELAQSATTVVYKGYQRAGDRFVLLKVLRPGVAHDEERVRRFEDEARLIAQVQHPNVVAVYGSGREAGQAYIATEFIDGFDLGALLTERPLPVALAVFVMREAARGLHAAHAHGILHRDLKPSNILVSHEGAVKLTDFGMASLVDEEAGAEVRGTPGYLAPELVQGAPPTRASDLFSLGATFYEALGGRPAFPGTETGALLDAALHHHPMPWLERFVDLPEGVYPICARLLAKDPAERYPGTEALIGDLDALRVFQEAQPGMAALKAYLDDPAAYQEASEEEVSTAALPASAAAERPAAQPARVGRRRRWAWGLGLAVLLAGGLGGSLLLQGDEPEPAPPVLTEEAAIRLPEADTSRTVGPAHEEAAEAPAPLPAVEPPGEPQAPETLPAQDTLAALPLAQADTSAVPESVVGQSEEAAPDPAEALGTLSVAVQPWAEVFVGGERKGQVPPNLSLPVPVGTHPVVLRHPQFPAYTTEVTVRAAEATVLNISLWDLVGRLSVDAQPWAEVLIDNEVRDVTPVHDLIVEPGVRRLTLRNRALGAWDTTVVVRGGQSTQFRFDLTTKTLRR